MRRTSFAQLPVYKKWRAGDTKQEIQIKKVTGDKGLLVEELKEKLGVPADKIKINPTTGMIVLTVRNLVPSTCATQLTHAGAILRQGTGFFHREGLLDLGVNHV